MTDEIDAYVDTTNGHVKVMSKLSKAEERFHEKISTIIVMNRWDTGIVSEEIGYKIIEEMRRHIEEIMEEEEKLGHVKKRND